MSYNDFWFIETRDQKKNIKRWFLWGILLFAFVSIGVFICTKSMYQPIEVFEIQTTMPAVKVDEAKATNVNGYVKGQIKNNSEEDMNSGKYIKFDFYTKKDVNVGSEYIEIGTLKSMESKTYEIKFRYDNVEKFIITVTDTNK